MLAMGTKNGVNGSFSVQSKIFTKLKAQIIQMRYQNVQEGSSFTAERKKCDFVKHKLRNSHKKAISDEFFLYLLFLFSELGSPSCVVIRESV